MRFSDVSNIKKPIRIIFTSSEMVCQRIMLSWSLIIDINVKNIKNDKILWEKHSLILGNVAAPQKVDTERLKTDGK